MKTKHTQQTGFSIVEVLLAVVVILMLGGLAYLAYHSHHKKSPESTSTTVSQSTKKAQKSSTSTTKTSTTPATSYFTIKEWGVQAPYSGSDYAYSAAPGSSSEILLESKTLDAGVSGSGTSCAEAGNAGSIGRYLPTDTIPGAKQQTAQQYLSQDFAGSTSPSYAKIGNYYYIYWEPGSGCSNEDTITNQVVVSAESLVTHLVSVQ